MNKKKRAGHRNQRSRSNRQRIPNLGYYIVVTNTQATEKFYFNEFRNSIPETYRNHITLKTFTASTRKLITEAERIVSSHPQYGEAWIVLDRDEEVNFDELIDEAQRADIHVGWSNPCFEIWLCAYWGAMPVGSDSVACCREFGRLFRQRTGRRYRKSDPSLYRKLVEKGDESRAITIAENMLSTHRRNGIHNPSKMCPCTTVHELIREIREKTP